MDAGCVWDAATALKRAEKFTAYNIGWLEEPLSQDDMEGYQWLRERSPVPIAAGEGECGWFAFKPWIENQVLDIYQVDLARNGFTEAKIIGEKVEEKGAKLCNHCYKTPISVAACLHWLSTTDSAFLFAFQCCLQLLRVPYSLYTDLPLLLTLYLGNISLNLHETS